jgi:hypothetical protein
MLYTKYGLSKEEITFIESMIRPMENSQRQDLQDSPDEQDLSNTDAVE